MDLRTIGVEEELMLVDPETGYLTGVATQALRAHDETAIEARADLAEPPAVEAELFLQQIEAQTPPCRTLSELATEIRRSRRAIGEAAAAAGAAAVAVAAPVLVDEESQVTPKPRYLRIREQYGELATRSLACALHVHVNIADEEEGVRVVDGIAPWLPVLLAISANSPYFHGRDTVHASWRSQIWWRWPSHGTREAFGNVETYREVSRRLIEWGAGLDEQMIYFDTRLSPRYPTVEIRVADVCTEVEDAVLVAGLVRALVTTSAEVPPVPGWRSDVLHAAHWRASRYGLGADLVDPRAHELASPRVVLTGLVDHCRAALEATGDLDVVESAVEQLLSRGNGAIRQRRAFESTGDLAAVVDDLCVRTAESWQ